MFRILCGYGKSQEASKPSVFWLLVDLANDFRESAKQARLDEVEAELSSSAEAASDQDLAQADDSEVRFSVSNKENRQ